MDPTRLLDNELDDFERALLRSARVDEPDARAIARAAVALGVGTTTLTVAAGAAAASGIPGASTAVGTFTKLTTLGIVKWLSIGVVGGLVTTSGVEIARIAISGSRESAAEVAAGQATGVPARRQQASDLAPVPVPPAPAAAEEQPPPPSPPMMAFADLPVEQPAPQPAAPKVTRSASRALPGTAPAPRGAAAPASTATATAAFTPPAAAAEAPNVVSIADETRMIDRARRALASGNAATALTELDSYDQRARARALSMEAGVLRIEALLQAGQQASAVALAQRLLAAQPNGPHTNRLRSIVASSPYLLRGSSLETPVR